MNDFLCKVKVYTRWKILEDDPVTSTVDMAKFKIRAFTGLKSDANFLPRSHAFSEVVKGMLSEVDKVLKA